MHVKQYSNHIWLCLSNPYQFYFNQQPWVSKVKHYPPNHGISSYWWPFFFWLHISFTQENKFDNQISTQAICSMLFHKQSMNSLPFWHIFPAHKTHKHFEHNVKLCHCLWRRPLSFSILWHSPFTVLTCRSDNLSKSCSKQTEFGSIIKCMYNIFSHFYWPSKLYNSQLVLHTFSRKQ